MLAVLDSEQEMLAETVRSLAATIRVANPHDLERIDEGKAWRTLADAGLLGLRRREGGVPVASGVEAMIVAHELGAALSPVPYVASGILGVELLELAGVGDAWAERIAAGSSRPGLLMNARLLDLADLPDPDAVMIGWTTADYALGLRRAAGGAQLIKIAVDGFESPVTTADLTTPLSLRLPSGDLLAEELGQPISEADLRRWTALALTLTSADCAGAMRAALDGVVEYSKVRIAYGVPIGSFQALQHMCADAFVACEGAVTTNNYAAWAVDALEPAAALLAARTAKAWTARVARTVTETVTQVYGGIGHTWEHVAHLYVRRVLLDATLFGAEAHQLDEIYVLRRAAELGGEDAEGAR